MMGRIYAFHGADRKDGSTMIAQSCAEYMAGALPDRSVLFVVMNGRPDSQYVKDAVPIDSFRSSIESGVPIMKSEITRLDGSAGLYVIVGTDEDATSGQYDPSDVIEFLQGLASQFDIIITDTGSGLEDGLAVGALASADRVFIVMSQTESSVALFERRLGSIEVLGKKCAGYIINRYIEKDPYSAGYVSKRLGISDLFCVSESGSGRRCLMEHRTLYALKDRNFTGGIARIASEIMADSDMVKTGKKSRWRSLF